MDKIYESRNDFNECEYQEFIIPYAGRPLTLRLQMVKTERDLLSLARTLADGRYGGYERVSAATMYVTAKFGQGVAERLARALQYESM